MVRARIREDEGLAAVCRRFWGCRWRPAVAVVSEMAGRGHGKRRSRPNQRRSYYQLVEQVDVGLELGVGGGLGHGRAGSYRVRRPRDGDDGCQCKENKFESDNAAHLLLNSWMTKKGAGPGSSRRSMIPSSFKGRIRSGVSRKMRLISARHAVSWAR